MISPNPTAPRGRAHGRHRQRGAALLLAMVILTLVATLASSMVWQQWRAIEVEGAERARMQSAWILSGALDWARLILREDARTRGPDHLGEPWAVPLAEARLSTFLAADRGNTVDDDDIEAFLSGSIEDAQARFNVRNVALEDTEAAQKQLLVLQRLCERAGLPADLAVRMAQGLREAWSPKGAETAPLAPMNVDQLAWLGVERDAIERLRPWVTVLPEVTPVNLNTAPGEVLAAAMDGVDLGTAQRLVQTRQRTPFKSFAEVMALLPPNSQQLDDRFVSLTTRYFVVRGRLRLGERVLEEQSLVRRNGLNVSPVRRERVNLHLGPR
jgi:general secretion pathway protein K